MLATSNARVVGRTMCLALAGLCAALVVKYGASIVAGKRTASASVDIPVALVVRVMPDCECCKKERADKGVRPRKLVRLPADVTKDDNFKKRTRAVYVCEHCDGDSLIDNALRNHEARQDK